MIFRHTKELLGKRLVDWTVGDVLGAVVGAWILALPLAYLSPTDDSDRGWQPWNRSGFEIKIDAMTGCQYLQRGGAILPRLDGAARHVGCR